MKKQKRNKKFFAALLLGVLTLSGMAINVSAIDDNMNSDKTSNGDSYGVFKDIKNNPFDFIKTEKLSIPSNFDYIEQMNNEFAGNFYLDKESSYFAGDSLKALKKKSNK